METRSSYAVSTQRLQNKDTLRSDVIVDIGYIGNIDIISDEKNNEENKSAPAIPVIEIQNPTVLSVPETQSKDLIKENIPHAQREEKDLSVSSLTETPSTQISTELIIETYVEELYPVPLDENNENPGLNLGPAPLAIHSNAHETPHTLGLGQPSCIEKVICFLNIINDNFFFYHPNSSFFEKVWQTLASSYLSYKICIEVMLFVSKNLLSHPIALGFAGSIAFIVNFYFSQKTIGTGLGEFHLYKPQHKAATRENQNRRDETMKLTQEIFTIGDFCQTLVNNWGNPQKTELHIKADRIGATLFPDSPSIKKTEAAKDSSCCLKLNMCCNAHT